MKQFDIQNSTLANNEELQEAMRLINDFCISEYDGTADFSDLRNIGIAYTTLTDDEIGIQVNVDLVNCRIEKYLWDTLVGVRQHDSLRKLIDNELVWLVFEALIHVSDDEWEIFDAAENR